MFCALWSHLGKLQQAPGQHGGGKGQRHPILDKACIDIAATVMSGALSWATALTRLLQEATSPCEVLSEGIP